ncbi:MAG TPA: aspartyl/asparaginyl beta-hydroxylase domain-containing protein [Arenimonas sp.]|uniref:aspartyl/asparaginyl beta-hydroxylase domain-containing protein n=1 Tax=Arenimonas sp. TaxID=1872635 RepID=UPI002D80FA7A|nr:aspartyl/asparaginyl beta-hydroxylase domain-containing protein [Arenimonas sp.]HEU0154194.1 aspartyl/asparaginyl beta-hydroxylase domain-containing protein [Arenimonas sp.]
MSEAIKALVQAAGAAANQGRWSEAEPLWRKVLAIDPRHPQALYSLGVHAFKRGQLAEAHGLLQAAHASAPGEPAVAISLAVVLREMGDAAGELRAIEASLVADPYFLPGLLAKAAYLQRLGKLRAAAMVYRNALKVVPQETQWPPSLRPQLLQGRELVERVGREMAAFLSERIGARAAALTPSEAERWREAGAVLSGQSTVYPSVCSRLQVPRLPAIPFFDRADFAWVPEVESRTEAIIAEMRAAMSEDQAGFRPYIAYEAGVPVNQWHELNHSKRWSSYFLWQHAQPIHEHLARCPETARALEAVEMADIGGLCPNAMFSALAPHTHIPPHHGETNARLVVHLPLVVPDHCLYRVGHERRRWTVGELLIFDDSIEHEARNDSDELRVVLIFDVWNPLLSMAERDMVRVLSAASAEFQLQA